MKKYLIIGLVVVLVAVVVGVAIYFATKDNGKEETAKLTKVRLNEVTRSVFYAPQYVAIALGYF